MNESFNSLPDHIKKHLVNLAVSSGLTENSEELDKVASIWLDKKKMFEEQIKSLDMIEVETLEKSTKKAMLLLTYSGSLLSMGCLNSESRWIEYASIKLRPDVPEIAKAKESDLATDAILNQNIELTSGPIKSSSSLFKISTFTDDVPFDEQEKRIRQATIFLTNAFVKINRTYFKPDEKMPEQFNNASIISYLADKNDLTKKQTKQIIDDYYSIIECGLLLGEKVTMGTLGKLSLKKRKAQKARIGRNPITGEKITINAKPDCFAPKISFGKNIKEKSANIRID